ncbi:MAG: HAD family hydrolase [Candidatus Micrarchaeia archaeon]
MSLKVVLVDIDETMFNTKAFSKMARMKALRAMRKEGMKAGIANAYAMLMKIVKQYGPNYSDHFGKLLGKLGEGRNSRIIAAGIAAYHGTKVKISPYSDSVKALRLMKRAGLKVYAATEGRAVKQWDKLVRLGLQDEIDGAFISEELGVGKSPEFYRRIARKLRIAPKSILMAGDKLERDYLPARKAGMNAVLVLRKGGKVEKDVCSVKSLAEAAKIAVAMKKK